MPAVRTLTFINLTYCCLHLADGGFIDYDFILFMNYVFGFKAEIIFSSAISLGLSLTDQFRFNRLQCNKVHKCI